MSEDVKKWKFVASEDPQIIDDEWVLGGTSVSVQCCMFESLNSWPKFTPVFSVNSHNKEEGTFTFHKEFTVLGEAKAFAESLAKTKTERK